MSQVLVERLVIFILELGFGPRPECLRLIDGLLGIARLEDDGHAQVIRVLAYQRPQSRRLQEFLVLVAQVHDDFGTAIRLV